MGALFTEESRLPDSRQLRHWIGGGVSYRGMAHFAGTGPDGKLKELESAPE